MLALSAVVGGAPPAAASMRAHLEELVLMQFREVAFKFRGHCGQIINLLKQPVPFPYAR